MVARFTRIHPVPLKETIAEALREAIFREDLKPGGRIAETRISREMHVGQNTAREALFLLESEGLVVRHPNRGCSVYRLSQEDHDKIYRFRVECEGAAVQFAREAGRPDEDDVRQFEQILDTMQAAAAA